MAWFFLCQLPFPYHLYLLALPSLFPFPPPFPPFSFPALCPSSFLPLSSSPFLSPLPSFAPFLFLSPSRVCLLSLYPFLFRGPCPPYRHLCPYACPSLFRDPSLYLCPCP